MLRRQRALLGRILRHMQRRRGEVEATVSDALWMWIGPQHLYMQRRKDKNELYPYTRRKWSASSRAELGSHTSSV